MKDRFFTGSIILGFALFFGSSEKLCSADVGLIEVVAKTGDQSPDGNGEFYDFLDPVINNAGQVAFFARMAKSRDGANHGIFRGSGDGINVIVRSGQAAPDGNGIFGEFSPSTVPAINDLGDIAFWAKLENTASDTLDNQGIFIGNGATLDQIARSGMSSPEGDGILETFLAIPGDWPVDTYSINTTLNNAGQVAFYSRVISATEVSEEAVFLYDGENLTTMARQGQMGPAGYILETPNEITDIDVNVVLNERGAVAFTGTYQVNSPAFFAGFKADSMFFVQTNLFRAVAREGLTTPDENLEYSIIYRPNLNDKDQIAFDSSVHDVSSDSFKGGIFVGTYNPESSFGGNIDWSIIKTDDVTPDDLGQFSGIGGGFISFNNDGQVAFWASFTENSIDPDSELPHGIFRSDGTNIVEIARTGQSVPDGNGKFAYLNDPVINQKGQAVFSAELSETSGGFSDSWGIYFYDDSLGLLEVVRTGEVFLDSSIYDLTINWLTFWTGDVDEHRPINDNGQVTFGFVLDDFGSGIAIWTPPPIPSGTNIEFSFESNNRSFILAWLGNFADWVLEATDDITDENSWVPLVDEPVLVGDYFELAVPVATDYQFFRLRQVVE